MKAIILWALYILAAADFLGGPRLSGLAPLTVNFDDLSTSCGTDAIVDWNWDFNHDGTVDSSLQSPSHTFTDIGLYTVSLKVEDEDGDTHSVAKGAYVSVPCGCDLDLDGDCDGTDTFLFIEDFDRTNCDQEPPCGGNYDGDSDVDAGDLKDFVNDIGRVGCPH